jgi:hypothetical protein
VNEGEEEEAAVAVENQQQNIRNYAINLWVVASAIAGHHHNTTK